MDPKKQISLAFWQGLVKLVVLQQAGQGPVYGGKLRKYLHGWGYDISPGSLYPLLHNLERAALLSCRIKIFRGRTRKYYQLTPQGQECLEALRREVSEVVREVILGGLPESPQDSPQPCVCQLNCSS
jgi:PadR family transcriptional regulator PadR